MRGALALIVLLGACAAPQVGPVGVLAVGDSVLAWNRLSGGDIPRVAATQAGVASQNRAVLGARFLETVPGQYREGPWDWVIVNGGANDLRGTCGCDGCDATLDALVTPGGQGGAMPDFARDMVARDHKVILLGYYGTSVAGGPFADCADELSELSRRLALTAAADPGITFVDAKAAIDPADLGLYAPDLAHPSAAGSAAIGALVGAAMRTAP
ncbi:GDSL-like Lipase/Acylhydrolase family protein [Loktanella fryxellensis]|uniref:GDSL-like Lipase/Acylhydrolase family protein n=1 Tax=Loktanella fryxellensis TaxID=245187 RepID=A0A1H8FN13_9RHOB|nr:SGNH/GDSL hydrolase family protein [Loktanella fryxellensis]SEN32990.1 GDSL-like Lipase/Acylhydrolase family protein [Loktanella fryxellensis]